MTAHRCVAELKKKLNKVDMRSGSQRHRYFVGFFKVSVQHWYRAILLALSQLDPSIEEWVSNSKSKDGLYAVRIRHDNGEVNCANGVETHFSRLFSLHIGIRRTYYWVSKIGCLTPHATIFQLHRIAGGLKKLYLRSGSQRHSHFVGSFNVPIQAWTRGQPFYTIIMRNRPFSRLLRHAGDTEDVFST